MKIKNVAIVILIILAALGIGAWAFFSLQSGPKLGESGKQADTVAPTIRLNISSNDLALAITEGMLEISADADDNHILSQVEYLLDGKVVARSVEPPFRATISLKNLSKGTHTLQAVAYDSAGNSGKSKVFTFEIREEEVSPADETSEEIVSNSTSRVSHSSLAVAVNHSSNPPSGNGSGGGSGGDGGGDPDPDPDPVSERAAGGWYSALPTRMQVCSNNVWNQGPVSAPTNAITVPSGDNAGFNFSQAGKTYWFAPGVHTIGSGEFSNITVGQGSTYIGAPGAIIDGQFINKYAFVGGATGVRIAYLEIRNFGVDRSPDPANIVPVNNNEGVINHDAADGWTMEYLNAHHNDGAAIFLGSENIVRNNCMKDNGQYGFSMFKPPADGVSAIEDIVIDQNEISGNNQDDWEVREPGCGCTGGGKFWDVKGATVTNNYVHDNLSTGLWADTNDIDFLFDSNWIEHNTGEGIWYEISYNATISRNVIKRNAWVGGNHNLGSPAAAIYISESGGDSRLQSSTSGSTSLRITKNLIEDNFSGVSIFENANRFCNSNGNTSKGYCTPFVSPTLLPEEPRDYTYPNPISNEHPCYTHILDSVNYPNLPHDCRWNSQNVQVFDNEFRFNEEAVPCAGTFCGVQALFATGDNNIPWDPPAYDVANVQQDVMHNNNNKFYSNKYFGNWRFAKGYGETIFFNAWQSNPFLQDIGSTFDGQATPPPNPNALDDDTSTLEGSLGEWVEWFSATPTQSTEEAHSGTHSLKLEVTAGGSFAAETNNWPGFPTTPGNKRISFWAKRGIGSISTVSMRLWWYDSSQHLLHPDDEPTIVPLAGLTTNWQQASLDVPAPAGAATVLVRFIGSGSAGNTVYADDFVIADIVD